ncbi:MAG: glucose-6-phosphate isomerase [Calditrichaeota bacterium]|nr:MAG: glucose-6-phosphate isomerase [Calditrichota bacterium]
MSQINVNFNNLNQFISDSDFANLQEKINLAHNDLHSKTGRGNDYLGWLDLPQNFPVDLMQRITEATERYRKLYDTFVVIGIGGSYLGAKAIIESLSTPFGEPKSEVIFAGHTLSSHYHSSLLEYLKTKNPAVVVISKSGTTTEPAIAFRLLKDFLRTNFPNDYKQRIMAITDSSKGTLRNFADMEGYTTFSIPDDVGGRFSVLTPVGLVPIALAGFEIAQLVEGAASLSVDTETDLEKNQIYKYAAARYLLHEQGKSMEILSYFEPRLSFFAEWWKQLFGESEGKENKGLFPASACFTTDLHSLGQYIQEGKRNFFETFLTVAEQPHSLKLKKEQFNTDKLNYLEGKSLDFVNQKAFEGTAEAHLEGNVPNLEIRLSHIDEFTLGQLIYFYEKAVAIGGYLLEVNPFDQPGVELYKKNMFRLLGKPS